MTDVVWLADATASLLPSDENAMADTPLDPDSSSDVKLEGILQDCPGSLDQATSVVFSSWVKNNSIISLI